MNDRQIIARVRYCVLHGTSAAELHDALAALGIEGGREPQPDALERVRDCTLRDNGCTRAEMAAAFSDTGVSGGGDGGEQAARAIRRAILYDL